MNEELARNVVLVRAIESTDTKQEVLSEADRLYASRSAKELALWQAADSKAEVTFEHFLQQRSEQILKRLCERTPSFAPFVKRRHTLNTLSLALPLLALLLGAGMDRIGDPHRVDLLSAPLLLIIGWNLLVYAGLLVWLFVPARQSGAGQASLVRRLALRKAGLPRKLPHVLSAAVFSFLSEWSVLSARLVGARLARTVHLSAALFALGALLSLYARGFLTQYVAGWESTFLDAPQVHAILSVLFAPAMWLLQMPGFGLAEIEALRFGAAPSPAGGAAWVHLYAATLLLLVVLPRLALAGLAGWKAGRLSKKFPLDLEQPYFRKLDERRGDAQAALRILPYSFTLDEARVNNLDAIATGVLGEPARALLQPSFAYGDEAPSLSGAKPAPDAVPVRTALLFNLSATPEQENHGAFLAHALRDTPRGLLVLIDESAYLERLGKERSAERVILWREFCNFHQVPATIVNLLHPPALDRAAR